MGRTEASVRYRSMHHMQCVKLFAHHYLNDLPYAAACPAEFASVAQLVNNGEGFSSPRRPGAVEKQSITEIKLYFPIRGFISELVEGWKYYVCSGLEADGNRLCVRSKSQASGKILSDL